MLLNLFQILESAAVSQQVKVDSLRGVTIWRFWNIVTHRFFLIGGSDFNYPLTMNFTIKEKSDIFRAIVEQTDAWAEKPCPLTYNAPLSIWYKAKWNRNSLTTPRGLCWWSMISYEEIGMFSSSINYIYLYTSVKFGWNIVLPHKTIICSEGKKTKNTANWFGQNRDFRIRRSSTDLLQSFWKVPKPSHASVFPLQIWKITFSTNNLISGRIIPLGREEI